MTTTPADGGPSGVDEGSARAAGTVGAGILLSRIAGFFREATFAFYFGNSSVADVWRAALRTPNVIQNLLGEGTLSASFIPIYAELLEEGREEDAGRFAGAVLGILAVVAGAAALAGIVLAPWLVAVFFPRWDPAKQELTVRLVRILFPMTGILVVSAWALGVLNTHRRFFVSYVAPVAWNVAMIAAMVGFGTYAGWEAVDRDADLATALAWGALVGGLLQLGVQLPWVVAHLRHFRLAVSRRVVGVREAIRNFLPVVTARGVVNLSGWLDVVLAGLLAGGSVAILGYAQTLYVLPISLFGMSVAASELPELSRRRKATGDVLAPRVSRALRRTWFLIVPSAVAYLLLGDVLTAALYQRGDFGAADTVAVYAVLAAYALGLPASASSRVLSSAYYAIRDTRTPARIASLRVVISAAVGASLMFPLDRVQVAGLHLGAAGLALGASVAAWTEYGLLRRRLRDAIGDHGIPGGVVPRYLAAAAAAGAAGVAVHLLLPAPRGLARSVEALAAIPAAWIEAPLVALETLLAFGVVYLGVTGLLGVGLLRSLDRPE